eukprot:12778576-Ditylum_brightwellii.AAC.1
MAGADRARFGSMFRDIQNNYGQGNDKYPKSVDDAKRYINTYKPDPKAVRVINQNEGVEFAKDGKEQQKKKTSHKSNVLTAERWDTTQMNAPNKPRKEMRQMYHS